MAIAREPKVMPRLFKAHAFQVSRIIRIELVTVSFGPCQAFLSEVLHPVIIIKRLTFTVRAAPKRTFEISRCHAVEFSCCHNLSLACRVIVVR
jgi:hypothetical protein